MLDLPDHAVEAAARAFAVQSTQGNGRDAGYVKMIERRMRPALVAYFAALDPWGYAHRTMPTDPKANPDVLHVDGATRDAIVYIARCPEHGLHGERTECFVCHGPVEQVAMVPVGAEPFNAEPMYTLEAAARVLAREECALNGHTWTVIEEFGVGPTELLCSNCSESIGLARKEGGPPGD